MITNKRILYWSIQYAPPFFYSFHHPFFLSFFLFFSFFLSFFLSLFHSFIYLFILSFFLLHVSFLKLERMQLFLQVVPRNGHRWRWLEDPLGNRPPINGALLINDPKLSSNVSAEPQWTKFTFGQLGRLTGNWKLNFQLLPAPMKSSMASIVIFTTTTTTNGINNTIFLKIRFPPTTRPGREDHFRPSTPCWIRTESPCSRHWKSWHLTSTPSGQTWTENQEWLQEININDNLAVTARMSDRSGTIGHWPQQLLNAKTGG